MKTLTLLAAVLVTGTLGAQSSAVQAEKRVQVFGEFSRPRQFTLAQLPSGDVKDQAASQVGGGIRFMGELPGTTNWFFEFGGKLDTSSRLGFNQTVSGVSINSSDIAIHYSYWEIGGAYLWDLGSGFNLGVHLDARSETIFAQGQFVNSNGTSGGTMDQRGTMLRPWVRLSADFAFKVSGINPYVGADVAFTPIRSTQNAVVPPTLLDDRTLKSMAPQFGASVYFGLRF